MHRQDDQRLRKGGLYKWRRKNIVNGVLEAIEFGLAMQGYIITGKDDTGLTVRKVDDYNAYIHITAEEIPA